MSAQNGDDERRPSREIAYRLFAAEFDDASFSYSESDEERAPNYVVTPTGARINRLFAVGVLTEVEYVNDDVLRGRIVDPTGAFVSYAGQYQPEEMAFLDRATPPTFVALSGKARTFQPDDSDRVFTSVRPESVSEVDADTRDRWTVSAAEATLDRIGVMAAALESGLAGGALRDALVAAGVDASLAAGVPLALDHYGTTPAYLDAVRRVALDALEVVAGDRDSVRSLDREPSDAGEDVALSALAADLELAPVETAESVEAAVETPAADENSSMSTEPTATSETGADSSDAVATESATEPEATSSDTVTTDSPSAGEPSITEPSTTEPSTAEPSTAEPSTAEPSTAEPSTTEPSTAEPSTTEPATAEPSATTDADELGTFEDDSESLTGSPDELVSETATSTEPASEPSTTTERDELGDFDTGDTGGDDVSAAQTTTESVGTGGTESDELGDEMYELDAEERAAVEEEFGTEFSTGSEVAPAGEADIDVPSVEEVEEVEEVEAESEAPTAPSTEPTGEAAGVETGTASTEAEADDDVDAEAETPDGDSDADAPVDLESAAVNAMAALDDGDGASREAVIAHVVDEHGADPESIEEAINSALMSGQCYEPTEDSLKAI